MYIVRARDNRGAPVFNNNIFIRRKQISPQILCINYFILISIVITAHSRGRTGRRRRRSIDKLVKKCCRTEKKNGLLRSAPPRRGVDDYIIYYYSDGKQIVFLMSWTNVSFVWNVRCPGHDSETISYTYVIVHWFLCCYYYYYYTIHSVRVSCG